MDREVVEEAEGEDDAISGAQPLESAGEVEPIGRVVADTPVRRISGDRLVPDRTKAGHALVDQDASRVGVPGSVLDPWPVDIQRAERALDGVLGGLPAAEDRERRAHERSLARSEELAVRLLP